MASLPRSIEFAFAPLKISELAPLLVRMVQLLYVSSATHPFSARELAMLLARSRASNSAAGLTGVLLYHAGSFLQIIEGPEAAVDATYARIIADPRHGRMKLVSRTEISQRQFTNWSMGFVELSSEIVGSGGFTDFLESGVIGSLTSDEGRIVRVMAAFRAGGWRQRSPASLVPPRLAPDAVGSPHRVR